MPSAIDRQLPTRAGALALTAVLAMASGAALAAAPDGTPSREQVHAAVEAVANDSNLPGMRAEQQLRFKPGKSDEPQAPDPKKPADSDSSGWQDFMASLSRGARLAVWGLGAALVLWVLWRLRHWIGWRASPIVRRRRELPSHVGTLDIRPDSLPGDVGRAAAELWQRNQGRAALSLLYRGALSRLVHVYDVPIRGASTEGECLALSAPFLPPPARDHLADLIGAWQMAAYAGRLPDSARVLALCERFDAYLPAHAALHPGTNGLTLVEAAR